MTQERQSPCGASPENGCDCDRSPIFVEATRGGIAESVHRGRACIVDAAGRVLESWGDINALVFPRSAIKPIQAIPLVESGAAQALGVSDAEIALACASHAGETRHTRAVAAWLARMGLSSDDLECGPQEPDDPETAAELIRAGDPPGALHNNCSGKHTGFLATAKYMGEPLQGYVRFEHPVQQRVFGVVEEMSGQDLSAAPVGVDGCSAPAIAMPLAALACAMARIANPVGLSDQRADAIRRIRTAWAAHSYLIAGRNSFDTEVIRGTGGQALVKKGAEGVAVAVLPRLGLGVALKIDDGAARARDVAMATLIHHAGAVSKEQWRRMVDLHTVPVMTRAGRDAGVIRPVLDWLGPVEE